VADPIKYIYIYILDQHQQPSRYSDHGYIHSARRPDQVYIYFMGSDTPPSMRCKLRDKIIIPSARV